MAWSRKSRQPRYRPVPSIRNVNHVFPIDTMESQENKLRFLAEHGMERFMERVHQQFGGEWRAEVVMRRAEDGQHLAFEVRHDPKTGRVYTS